jgi:hypothetical protein
MNPKLKYFGIFLVVALVIAIIVLVVLKLTKRDSTTDGSDEKEYVPPAANQNSAASTTSTSSSGIQQNVPIAQANRDTVKAIQNYINTLRVGTLSPITVDGIYGNQTKTAAQAVFGQDITNMTYPQIQAIRATPNTANSTAGSSVLAAGTGATTASSAAVDFAQRIHNDLGSYASDGALYDSFSQTTEPIMRQTHAYWNDKYKHLHEDKNLYRAIDPSIFWVSSKKASAVEIRRRLALYGLV